MEFMEHHWKHPIQMTPGPSEPYPEALLAQAARLYKHYGEEWLRIYNEFIDLTKKLFGVENGVIIPFYGSASASMEAVLNSLERGKILFINDGFFVRRFKEIALIYGYDAHHVVPEEIGRRVDKEEVRLLLESEDFKAVVVVHSETSTGVLEDIAGLREVIPEDTLYIVDAVSSYGALRLDVERKGIDVCLGYSSKALGAVMGVTPIYLSDRVVDLITSRSGYRGFSNDLKTWLEYIEKWPFHPYPTTIPTNTILAYVAAARLVLDIGLDKVEERHWRISKYVYRELEKVEGLEPLPMEGARTPTVSVFWSRAVDPNEVVDYLIKNYGYMISTALFAGYQAIRIGHMGYTAQMRFVYPVVEAIKEFFSGREK